MTFANPLPWWVLALLIPAAAAIAWHTYRHFEGLPARRGTLMALRLVTLLLLILFLMRPVTHTQTVDRRSAVVPILVDTSRSMGIRDSAASTRIDRARRLVSERLLPTLGTAFRTELLGFDAALQPRTPQQLTATGRRSDLRSALRAVRERYEGQAVAGIILLSDGGDTSDQQDSAPMESAVPIYSVGLGDATLEGDREIVSLTAAEAVLDDSRLGLAVTAVSHEPSGPIELRLLENGRPIQVARVTPAAPGTPVYHLFQAAPPRGAATVYTVDTPALPTDPVPENNTRSVVVRGATRPRRILLLQGAPGFDHSFLTRAWGGDDGLEVDAVVRKGKDEQGKDTFYIQASRARGTRLTSGYPVTPADLDAYDAVVLANVDRGMLTATQLEATREFVSRRGGGLLVLGGASFSRQGLIGTALEDALPLVMDGGASIVTLAAGGNGVALTPDGAGHPIMQIGEDGEKTRQRWAAMPPVAALASVGAARPGASVLALSAGAGGVARPLVAVQRYGEGRTMMFTGEASWRWRMLLPSSDRSYETFWRQAIRWLALPAGDPVRLTLPVGTSVGDDVGLRIDVRDASYQPVPDASVAVRVTGADGHTETLPAQPDPAARGSFVATYRPRRDGVHRVTADARRGTTALGSVEGAMLVGGAEVEMADPRLDTALLQRLALASGGHLIGEDEIPTLAAKLTAGLPATPLSTSKDLWHSAWSFVAIVLLLSTEWMLRRRWGLP